MVEQFMVEESWVKSSWLKSKVKNSREWKVRGWNILQSLYNIRSNNFETNFDGPPTFNPTFFANGKLYCSLCFANYGTLVQVLSGHNCQIINRNKPVKFLQTNRKVKSKCENNENVSSLVSCEICKTEFHRTFLKDHMKLVHKIELISNVKPLVVKVELKSELESENLDPNMVSSRIQETTKIEKASEIMIIKNECFDNSNLVVMDQCVKEEQDLQDPLALWICFCFKIWLC